jgi:thiosulfate dehydrogenase [quinone] large subunit
VTRTGDGGGGDRTPLIEDPPIARALLGDVRWAWVWVVPRVYLGWAWWVAGWAKWHSAQWTGEHAGGALARFVTDALTKTGGQHPDVQWWYARFLADLVLPHPVFWSYLVSGGEVLVGGALILGLFTGVAAFSGSVMNVSYLLAGTVSTNPILFAIATSLILAWKTAGWWGLDRWLLPALGTPWRPGYLCRGGTTDA